MNNIIERTWKQNSLVTIEDLRGMTFQAESDGHTFVISAVDANGDPITMSGTPAGVMLRPDHTDQVLTCSVSGGKVYATLPAGCYDVPGRAGITIFLTSDSQKTAIYAAIVSVSRTSSGTAAPGTTASVVDLVNAINTAIGQIPASDTNIKAAMAPTYSNTGLYSVGQYAWYEGVLKKCIVPITTGETYTPAHWTNANLGADINDLKSALNGVAMFDGNRISAPDDFIQYKMSPVNVNIPTTGVMPLTNIYNIIDNLATTSTNCSVVYPIRIRDANGAMIYTITFDNGTATAGRQAIFYDKYGNYLSYVNAPNFIVSEIPADAYYMVLCIYHNKNQSLKLQPVSTVEIPSWFNIGGEECRTFIEDLRSTDGTKVHDYYSPYYAMSFEDFVSVLKESNTGGTWNNNVYTRDNGTVFTVNSDKTITADATNADSDSSMWLPRVALTQNEKVYLQSKATGLTCTFYKNSTNKGNVTNRFVEFTADASASYRFAIKITKQTTGTLELVNVYTGIPIQKQIDDLDYRVDSLEDRNVYHIGEGLDFETYTACIRALQGDDREKTIYIHSGTYDIYEETGGAAYWRTLSASESDWRNYCDIIPPNTTIIGLGDVNLNFMPTGTGEGAISEDASNIISPINISGSCTLENVTVNADNCRYAIHDETSGIEDFKGSVKKYKNVRVNRYTTYFTSGRWTHNDAFACGFDDEMTFEFENCDFYADTNGTPFRFHDRGLSRANIKVNNCVIHGNGNNRSMIRLEAVSSNTGSHSQIMLSSCYIGDVRPGGSNYQIHFYKSSGNRNAFDLTLLNCNEVTVAYSEGMTNPYTMKVFPPAN